MATQSIERNASLTEQIIRILIERIRTGLYQVDSQLPAETELAQEFEVSRATVRTAVAALAARGMVVRRHGIGTFVRRLSNISNPLNQFIDFFDLIRDHGYRPSFTQLYAGVVPPPAETVLGLHLADDDLILEVHKVFFADADPIIYCVNLIPQWVFQDTFTPEQVVQPDVTEPFFPFFEEKCRQPIHYHISRVRADLVGNCNLPGVFSSKDANLPVLVIDEIGYNADERPVHQSIEYHPGSRMDFKLIRS